MTPIGDPAHVKVLRELQQNGPATAVRLTEITGCKFAAVRGAISALRVRKEVYVASWCWSKNSYAMVLAAGSKPDAARPDGPPPPPPRKKPLQLQFPHAHTEAHVLAGLAGGRPTKLSALYVPGGPSMFAIEGAARRLGKKGIIRPPKSGFRLWTLPEATGDTPRRVLPIPTYALRSVFVGGINPWTGAQVTV